MRQSVGMSAQLNIIIIFILIVFALLAASLSYYKAYKVNNVISSSIEKYEGINDLATDEITTALKTLGYQFGNADCEEENLSNSDGYCVYYKAERNKSNEQVGYSYKVTTYMTLDLPIVDLIRIPVNTYTNTIACIKNNCK